MVCSKALVPRIWANAMKKGRGACCFAEGCNHTTFSLEEILMNIDFARRTATLVLALALPALLAPGCYTDAEQESAEPTEAPALDSAAPMCRLQNSRLDWCVCGPDSQHWDCQGVAPFSACALTKVSEFGTACGSEGAYDTDPGSTSDCVFHETLGPCNRINLCDGEPELICETGCQMFGWVGGPSPSPVCH
jgi:hypothetical protein